VDAWRSVNLGQREWRCAVDPPETIAPADVRHANAAGAVPTADELATIFATAVRPDVAVPIDAGVQLVALCQQAHQQYPGLAIDDRDLVAAIAARATSTHGYLDRCCAGDLALAIAASRGSQAAIAEVERAYRVTIDSLCRRFASATHTADELKQLLHDKLFVGTPPKIADYAGQGYLERWLRVTAVRIFLGKGAPDLEPVNLTVDRHRAPLAGRCDHVKSQHHVAVSAAMQEAAKQLDPGDRHLLRQHVVAKLSIEQLAAVLGIERATAVRRIARAREQLVGHTRRGLAQYLAAHELDQVIAVVSSELDVLIEQLLATAPVGRSK
jgi:RNA polymerase sigma-70 factor (ECF subfamily)